MDRFSFLGSVHAQLIDDQYEHYLKNPDGLEPSWRAFFQGYDFAKEIYSEEDLEGAGVPEEVIKEFHVLNLIQGYRSRGHLFTKTNPVRMRRSYEPTLAIENFGLTKDDLDTPFKAATELGLPGATKLREIISHLEAIYCQSTVAKIKGRSFRLIKPTTFMNLSGNAVRYWMQEEHIPIENVLVVVDDLALPLGAIRIREKGSDAGHNGLKDIQEKLGRNDYSRLKFGIGNDFPKGRQVDFVLGEWNKDEHVELPSLIEHCVKAIQSFALAGSKLTMTQFNKK